MPIKFRCNYCRQFLGISRNRAGGVVDCPSCGRAIRVPDLDGHVAPLEDPGLNGDDAQLARALDELAALAHVDLAAPVVATDVNALDEEIPQPIPEPVPVEISVPVVIPPVAAVPDVAAPAEPAVASLAEVMQELAGGPTTAVTTTDERSSRTPEPHRSRGEYAVRPLPLVWLVVSPLLAGLAGLLIGSAIAARNTNSPNDLQLAARQAGAADEVAIPQTQVSGRISYQTATGEVQPDIGAAVLVLPQAWTGASRLVPAGLRPGDDPADQKVAAAAAAAMGGQLAWTDHAGEYQLSLPGSGSYRLIVLSRLSARSAAIPPEDEQRLNEYLQDPPAITGQRGYLIRDVEARNPDANHWDHQFLQP